MPRKRKSIEGEHRRKAVVRQHEDRRDANRQVRQLIEGALHQPRPTPTLDDLVQMMLEHRELALSVDPPQVKAANDAVMGAARLLGMIVERQVSMVGSPEDFQTTDEAAIYARLRERVGTRNADRFMRFIAEMRADDQDGVIEGEPDSGPDGE